MTTVQKFDPLSSMFARPRSVVNDGFELTFAQTQRTVTTRLNEQIEEIQNSGDTMKKVKELQAKRDGLSKAMPVLQNYRHAAQGNVSRLETIGKAVSSAVADFAGEHGDYSSLSAADVAKLNAYKADIIATAKKLSTLQHPDIADTGVVGQVRKLAASLEGLTIEEGVIDAAGDPATNENRQALDLLNTLSSKVATAYDYTASAYDVANTLALDIQTDQAQVEAQFTELTAVDLAEKTAKIDELKEKTGRLLEAWSISHDLTMQQIGQMNDTLQGIDTIDPGSVLNLFA